MPRTAVQLWCDYFLSLDSLLKTELLQKMWQILSNDEQTAVITDLRQFIAMSLRDDINGIVGDRQDVLADNDNKNKNNNDNGDGDNNDSDI